MDRIEQAALVRAAENLRRNGIIPLHEISQMETARIEHNADNRYPSAIGWMWISDSRVHYSSSDEAVHPQKIFKLLITALEDELIQIDVDHRNRSIRLKPEA